MDITTFSPKEAAAIIGVSESSVKRWVDAGHIQVYRTKGGHRRIELAELIQFARSENLPIVRPDLIHADAEGGVGALDATSLYNLLATGDGRAVRRGLLGAYLDGRSAAKLMDEVAAPAFDRLGHLWKEGDDGIFVEHRAVSICLEALQQLRLAIPERNGKTPVIVGGAPTGDPYLIPSLGAALALRDAGYQTVQLGPETPVSSFIHAVESHGAKLVWLSLTSMRSPATMQGFIDSLAGSLADTRVRIVVGGQASRRLSLDQPAAVTILSTMQELVLYARESLSI